MESSRKFKIIVNSKECGTCSGATPSAVAKKVVKKLCGTSSKVVKFSLKECKRGCERVCGPYQGRMEKLDRPCKRGGKTITHRVVCWKVRKMRGGALSERDFEKREDYDFKIDKIGLRPHIFFGEVKIGNQRYYKYVIFNNEHFGGNEKKCGFNELKIDGETISIVSITGEEIIEKKNNENEILLRNNNQHQITNNTDYDKNKSNLLSLLKSLLYCEKLTDYKTIRKTIYVLLKIKDKDNLLEQILRIPEDFFTRDYLPEVITAEGECVPDGFYNLLPNTIDLFKNPDKGSNQKTIIHCKGKDKGDYIETHVYFYIKEDGHNSYFFFSNSENDNYYNLFFKVNNTSYIAIFDHRNRIVNCYPINIDLYSLTLYPFVFKKLVKCLVVSLVFAIKNPTEYYTVRITLTSIITDKFNEFYIKYIK